MRKESIYYWCFYRIQQRCTNTNAPQYEDYGGRGISCFWQDAVSFEEWILENLGEKPEGKSLDRHPDNDGNYEPGNLRWATREEQNLNRRLHDTGKEWKWTYSLPYDRWIGKFSHQKKVYHTRTCASAEEAHYEVLQIRSQMGLRC